VITLVLVGIHLREPRQCLVESVAGLPHGAAFRSRRNPRLPLQQPISWASICPRHGRSKGYPVAQLIS